MEALVTISDKKGKVTLSSDTTGNRVDSDDIIELKTMRNYPGVILAETTSSRLVPLVYLEGIKKKEAEQLITQIKEAVNSCSKNPWASSSISIYGV